MDDIIKFTNFSPISPSVLIYSVLLSYCISINQYVSMYCVTFHFLGTKIPGNDSFQQVLTGYLLTNTLFCYTHMFEFAHTTD